MPLRSKSLAVPEAMQNRFREITALTDEVCRESLNEDYGLLCRELAAALGRKRPSPLNGGQANTWACGIVYTIGFVNFLFDKSQTPHMRADQLCARFNVAASSGGNKAKLIRDMLRITQFDSQWMLPSRVRESTLAWLISVDGLIIDARLLPRSLQQEAFHKGLIPYVPADEDGGE